MPIYGWGVGDWGGIDGNPWGGVGDAAVSAPTIDAVISPEGPSPNGGQLVDVLGGDVIEIIGTEFEDPLTVEVLIGPSGGPYTVVGTCYMFDARYDLTTTRAFVGTPALAQGIYHVRVTNSVNSAVLEDALDFQPFAEELKVHRVRVGFARVWATGRRMLLGGL
jgi:hypothetical protein